MYLLFYGVILLLSDGHAQENGTTEVWVVVTFVWKTTAPIGWFGVVLLYGCFFVIFFLFKEQGVFLGDILFLL